jgi:hypothetical protein
MRNPVALKAAGFFFAVNGWLGYWKDRLRKRLFCRNRI